MAQEALSLLKQRLMETIAWCQAQPFLANGCTSRDFRYVWTLEQKQAEDDGFGIAVPVTILRTSALETHDMYNEMDSFAERYAAVEEMVHKRAMMLRQLGRYPDQARFSLAGGRLMLTDISNCDPRRNPIIRSSGFLDFYGCPPWDTWIAYLKNDDESLRSVRSAAWRSFLLSWVPPSLLDLASAGLVGNPVVYIAWAEDLDIPFARRLRAAGLLTLGR